MRARSCRFIIDPIPPHPEARGDSEAAGAGPWNGLDERPCPDDSILTARNFGAAFMLTYCTSCHAADLPASGLLFPLLLRTPDVSAPVVRTILSVSEADQSLTFAGDVPTGGYVRLMKANFDRLIDGAVGAGRVSADALGGPVDLALLISCVGRRMVLRQRVEEEVEGVRDIVGPQAAIAGFYSYGEISPFTPQARCELHNQTMTVTTLSER